MHDIMPDMAKIQPVCICILPAIGAEFLAGFKTGEAAKAMCCFH